jgi:hypothetical protein
MPWLPASLKQYFEALNGLESVLPVNRLKNRPLLLRIYRALQQEATITATDLRHLKTLKTIADAVVIPPFTDAKGFVATEHHLCHGGLGLSGKQIRYTLRAMAMLMARHEDLAESPETLRLWMPVWRELQRFATLEQPIMTGYVSWLLKQQFATETIRQSLRELVRFRHWLAGVGTVNQTPVSLDTLDERYLYDYLTQRAQGCHQDSKARYWYHLKPFFHYLQEALDGGLRVPEVIAPQSNKVVGWSNVSSATIDRLWQALESGDAQGDGALMLALVLGYGLPLKVLPLLRYDHQHGLSVVLHYNEQQQARLGVQERSISLDLTKPWLASLWAGVIAHRPGNAMAYLFQSPYGHRRGVSVSTEHCARALKATVQAVLGYTLTPKALELATLNHKARHTPLPDFMAETDGLTKSKVSRLYISLRNRS